MKQLSYYISKSVEWATVFVLGWVGYALDFDLERLKKDEFLHWLVDTTRAEAPKIVICSVMIIGISKIISWALIRKSIEQVLIDRNISDALDKFRDVCFPNLEKSVPVDHNRVTLFKHVEWKSWIHPFKGIFNPWGYWRWPWSGWLCVKYRSGHVTQGGTTIFLAPDDAQNSEGVAGETWRRGEAYRVGGQLNKLPDLNKDSYKSNIYVCWIYFLKKLCISSDKMDSYEILRSKVYQYAENTNTSPKLVWQRMKKRKTCPTSILGVVIENRKKERWGVLIMDSSNEHSCIDTSDKKFREGLSALIRELRRYDIFER
ncbi:hypothetical protein [uncultured Gimesia sp.]|uniref:hypothetical protein n=1 Tax=uncultured Gimesia sp. TaxID=1678688 RepID=UPI00261E0F35|nr:hypothetical protein [uncultured Gimesia sp.]